MTIYLIVAVVNLSETNVFEIIASFPCIELADVLCL